MKQSCTYRNNGQRDKSELRRDQEQKYGASNYRVEIPVSFGKVASDSTGCNLQRTAVKASTKGRADGTDLSFSP